MSHKIHVKTTVTDLMYIKRALERMGIPFTEEECNIRGTQAQIKISNAVGLALQEDGTYAFVGDPYYCPHTKKYYNRSQRFASELATAYAIEETTEELELQGFYCTENEEAQVDQQTGMIRMVYESYG